MKDEFQNDEAQSQNSNLWENRQLGDFVEENHLGIGISGVFHT